MNKKDVEHIGYVLSCSKSLEELRDRFFQMDSRIETEYAAFEYVSGRDEKIDEEFRKRMVERYGPNWSLLREKPPCKEVLEEVRREVYGEDYQHVFGNR